MAPRLPARCWAVAQQSATGGSSSSASALSSPVVTTVASTHASSSTTISLPLRPLIPLTARRSIQNRSGNGWSTLPPRSAFHLKYNTADPLLPKPTTSPPVAHARKLRSTPMRAGVLATKKGMTAYYTRNGQRFACTVLQMDRVQVVAHKTLEKNGYWAVQVGCGARNPNAETAPMLGYYEAKGIPPKEHLAEFQVRDQKGLSPRIGVQLLPDWFHKGQRVDVQGVSKGKGFAGGMKRHGFRGQGASHGNSRNHRTGGSVGPSQGSGARVHPGKKMAGNMGNENHTTQNLPILRVNNELGIVVVKGAVAGPKGGLVRIADACKKDPPTKKFRDKATDAAHARFPNARKDLEAARVRHLELKALRREGTLEDALKFGIMDDALSPNAGGDLASLGA